MERSLKNKSIKKNQRETSRFPEDTKLGGGRERGKLVTVVVLYNGNKVTSSHDGATCYHNVSTAYRLFT